MDKIEWRLIISTLLLIDFVFVALTGIALLFELGGGLLHGFIKEVHIVSGVLMIFLVIIHFSINYSLYVQEKSIFSKKDKKIKKVLARHLLTLSLFRLL